MPILTLLGAMAFALASAATLAFRVVRVPRSDAAKRGQAGRQAPRMAAGSSTATLLKHVTDEYQRHTAGLRVALNLRRARNETEAKTRLLNERARHAEAARKLDRILRPNTGWLSFGWVGQAWKGQHAQRVRREVNAVRVPAQTSPLSGERVLRRLFTWMRGGPRTGYANDLYEYHHTHREHYRIAKRDALKFAQANQQDEARMSLEHERDYHERIERELGEKFGQDAGFNPPSAPSRNTAPLAPVMP